jgi:hypothetical protein
MTKWNQRAEVNEVLKNNVLIPTSIISQMKLKDTDLVSGKKVNDVDDVRKIEQFMVSELIELKDKLKEAEIVMDIIQFVEEEQSRKAFKLEGENNKLKEKIKVNKQ